jgi:hypothetical protein
MIGKEIKKHDIHICPKRKFNCPNECEHKIPHEEIIENLTNYCKEKICMRTNVNIECKKVVIYEQI